MRANEFVFEIDRMAGSEYRGDKPSLQVGRGNRQTKKLPGTNAFMYSTEPNWMADGTIIKLWDPAGVSTKPVQEPNEDEYDFSYRLYDWERSQNSQTPGLLIGKLVLEDVPHFPLNGALQVDTITVDENYRGQGVAKSLYGIALSILRRPLVAGRSQTPGGRRNWLSLASTPGVEVKGYLGLNEDRLKNADSDIDTIMGRLGGQYIGQSRPPGIRYFAFDVVAGSGELAPAVKTSVSQIYGHTMGNFGLYATWIGGQQGLAERKQSPLEDFEGLQFRMVHDNGQLFVNAFDSSGSNELGHVTFDIGDGKELDPQDLFVKEKFQGQGIARIMYDFVKSKGYKIQRSWDQTDAGAGFWDKHRGEEERVWEQGVAEGYKHDYLSQISKLIWKPVSRSIWNTIQDEGLDEEQDAPDHINWVMASLSIDPKDAQALQAFDNDAIEDFNRFDIHLKSRYPGLTDLIDYDRGTVTIVKPINTEGLAENFADGKNPQDKGDSQRHGIPKNATMAELEKASHAKGRKGQLARWQLNMRRGHKK